jgi:hypothetical protein
MFRKRIRKFFPPGTFIPWPARVMAILQLCLVFTILLWNASQPFMGDLFVHKSKLLVFEEVMGINQENNRQKFTQLPSEERLQIVRDYESLKREIGQSFLNKVMQAGVRIFLLIPSLELAWILFSLLISLLLLLRVEGAVQAVWLLPLLALTYGIDNRLNGRAPHPTQEARLFPSESLLIENYLKRPLSQHIPEQMNELKQAWELFLIEKWAKEQPSNDPPQFTQQVDRGNFAFNAARLNKMREDRQVSKKEHASLVQRLESNLMLSVYFLWNLAYAVVVMRTMGKQSRRKAASL